MINPYQAPGSLDDPAASGAARSLIKGAWLVVILLFPVALLNYLDRQMLATMKFSVMKDITDIRTEENWGFMLAKFKWVYAFFSPLGGFIADRFSRKYTICLSLIAWSAVTWATGHVTTYNGLLWARAFMGISEAFYIPAALALITDYHLGATRSRAIGIHQTGIYCGQIAGGFTGYLADAPGWGWRTGFDIAGAAGILYALPLLIFLRDPVRAVSVHGSVSPVKPAVLPAARELFTNGSFVLLTLCFTLPAMAAWVVRDWMPAVLKKQFDVGQGIAGVSAVTYTQLAALGGAMFGGWLADRWGKRTLRGRLYTSAIGMALIVPALFGTGNASSLAIAVTFLVLFGLGWGIFDCNNMPILCQIVRPELRATGYGFMNLVSVSCGGVADWAFGVLCDKDVPLNVIFTAFSGITLISVVLLLLIRPRPALS